MAKKIKKIIIVMSSLVILISVLRISITKAKAESPVETGINITSNKYNIDENNYIYKISQETKLSELMETMRFSNVPYVRVLDKEGNLITDMEIYAGTGMQIALSEDAIYKLVVTGDVNGDGKISLIDSSLLKKHLVGMTTLEGEYEKAGDLDRNGEIGLVDISKIKRILVNLEQVEEGGGESVAKDRIKVEKAPTKPTNTEREGNIKVKIKYGEIETEETGKYQYRIGNNPWQKAEQEVNLEVAENTGIEVRYVKEGREEKYESHKIGNVDSIAPNEYDAKVKITTSSMTVTAETEDTANEGADAGTAGIEKYMYQINEGEWEDVGQKEEKTYTELKTGEKYKIKVKAIDKAGNETENRRLLDEEGNEIPEGEITIPEFEIDEETQGISIEAVPETSRNTEKTGSQNGIECGEIEVEITFKEVGLSNEKPNRYKIGNEAWQETAEKEVSLKITENTRIYSFRPVLVGL